MCEVEGVEPGQGGQGGVQPGQGVVAQVQGAQGAELTCGPPVPGCVAEQGPHLAPGHSDADQAGEVGQPVQGSKVS